MNLQKEGPSPGEYEDKSKHASPEITSVFKSKSGRFKQQKQFVFYLNI